MGEIKINKKINRKGLFIATIIIEMFIVYSDVYAYKAISPAMSDYINEAEEKIVISNKEVSDNVTQTIDTTNQSKFYEVILNEECTTEDVSYTDSYANYANTVTKSVLGKKEKLKKVKKAIIKDKMDVISVVGVSNFNVQVRRGTNIDELDLFYKIVQAEAGGEDLKGKVLVANVILNRVKSGKFPNSIRGVIMARGQFQPVTSGRIYSVTVSEQTKLAVEMALAGEDYSNGALYFMARSASSAGNVTWFDRALTRVVKHGNHEFFK